MTGYCRLFFLGSISLSLSSKERNCVDYHGNNCDGDVDVDGDDDHDDD